MINFEIKFKVIVLNFINIKRFLRRFKNILLITS